MGPHPGAEQGESMSKRKTALITGVTGQDGSYLAEFCRIPSFQRL